MHLSVMVGDIVPDKWMIVPAMYEGEALVGAHSSPVGLRGQSTPSMVQCSFVPGISCNRDAPTARSYAPDGGINNGGGMRSMSRVGSCVCEAVGANV